MKSTVATALRSLLRRRPRRFTVLCVLALAVGFVLLAGPSAGASDVYSNIGPAPQIPAGGLVERYPMINYELDQYFPVISVGLTSGVDVSGLAPFLAYFIAQVIWMITAFLAYAVITVFAFAFNLDLVNGNGSPGSGALTPVSTAIHNVYASTFGAPWLVAMVVIVGCWAMWKALVQRRYTETAGALAVSLLYFVLAVGIVTQPEQTIGPASKLSNQLSTALLSLTSNGSVGNESQAKVGASNQLFELLVLDPWAVLEFGGLEHCTTTSAGKTRSVAVRPLASNPTEDSRLAIQLETASEIKAQGKTCVNNKDKYASHFLAYTFLSHNRGSEHEALEKGDDEDLPESDPGKSTGTYPLGPQDKPAAEAMDKGGQYQRLLLTLVILVGEIGAFALLGSLAVGVIIAQILLLTMLGFAPVALLVGIFPGRGHEFFQKWLGKLAGYLARKAIYSLILAVILAVSQAMADATSNLGWLLAFGLQAAFLWTVFLQRNRLTADFLSATVGPRAGQDGASRLQSFYYTTRLARMAMGSRQQAPVSSEAPSASSGESLSQGEGPSSGEAPPSEGGGSPPETPPSGEGPVPGGGSPGPNETPTHGPGAPPPATPSPGGEEPGTDPGAALAGDGTASAHSSPLPTGPPTSGSGAPAPGAGASPVDRQAPGEIPSPDDIDSPGGSPPPIAHPPRTSETPADEDPPSPSQASRRERTPSQEAVAPSLGVQPPEPAPLPAPNGPPRRPVPDLPAPIAPPPGVAGAASDRPPLPEPALDAARLPSQSPRAAEEGSPPSIPPAAASEEPVAVLLRARETNAATDPATEGDKPA